MSVDTAFKVLDLMEDVRGMRHIDIRLHSRGARCRFGLWTVARQASSVSPYSLVTGRNAIDGNGIDAFEDFRNPRPAASVYSALRVRPEALPTDRRDHAFQDR